MRRLSIIAIVMIISFNAAAAQNLEALLQKADQLKFGEKYTEAEKKYDEALKLDPDNIKALQGKDDCRIMLSPIIPNQHLAPPIIDPDFQALVKKKEEAKTPWDKRRAEMAIERHEERYTSIVFGRESRKYNDQAEEIIKNAIKQLKKRQPADQVYLQAEQKLIKLQKQANQSWKGQGPEVLKLAINKLDNYFLSNNYSIPGKPFKTFRLKERIINADFDYEMIKKIDSISPPFPTNSKFQIADFKYIPGNFSIFKFIAEYQGRSSLSDKPAIFHDLLVLKTDNKLAIVDGFHYTLEWTDSPSLDLYRLSKKKNKLRSGITIRELLFVNIADGKQLFENGQILFKAQPQ